MGSPDPRRRPSLHRRDDDIRDLSELRVPRFVLRILDQLVPGAPDESSAETAVDALEPGGRELLAFTEPLGAQAGVATGTAEPLGFLGDIAAYRGDGPEAGKLYARAGTKAAGLPWYSVAYETEAARIAVELPDPRLQLAEVLAGIDGTLAASLFAPLPPHLLHEARRTARIAELI
ncbi:hypothetical protein ACIA8E_00450 [Streptomyces sp. NPDC051664]|uniref:hypothetical protein n=1 Tax=Streptomyces sp. NPDC051664 TaxID=3365668 RepID=UPI00379CEDAB